jgi:hypothetical protein
VLARAEQVAVLSEVDELRGLRLAHDELRAVLDFLVLVGKAVGSVSRESSFHSMISMNWLRMKSVSPMRTPFHGRSALYRRRGCDNRVMRTTWLVLCAALAAFPSMADVQPGTWAGEHIVMDVRVSGATVEFDCAHGTLDAPLALDSGGRFDVSGSFTPERGGPTRGDSASRAVPARYTGSLDARRSPSRLC